MAYYRRDDDDEELTRRGEAQGAPVTGKGAGGGTAAAGKPADYTQTSFVSGKKLLEKNANAAQPDLSKGFMQKADSQVEGLGKAFDQYGKGLSEREAGYQVDKGTVSSAVSGDDESFGRISAILRGPSQEAKAFDERSNLDVSEVNRFNTQDGLQGAFREKMEEGGNFGYTQGQSALDSVLYGRSQSGRDQRQAMVDKRQSTMTAFDEKKAAADKLREESDGRIKSSIEGLKGDLRGHQEAIRASGETRAKELKDHLGMTQTQTMAARAFRPRAEAHIKNLINEAGDDPELRAIFEQEIRRVYGNNPEQLLLGHMTMGGVEGPQYSQDEAESFGRISELLGLGDRISAGRGAGANSFDEAAFVNHLRDNVLSPARQALAARRAKEAEPPTKDKFETPNQTGGGAARPIDTYVVDPILDPVKATANLSKKVGFPGIGKRGSRLA